MQTNATIWQLYSYGTEREKKKEDEAAEKKLSELKSRVALRAILFFLLCSSTLGNSVRVMVRRRSGVEEENAISKIA